MEEYNMVFKIRRFSKYIENEQELRVFAMPVNALKLGSNSIVKLGGLNKGKSFFDTSFGKKALESTKTVTPKPMNNNTTTPLTPKPTTNTTTPSTSNTPQVSSTLPKLTDNPKPEDIAKVSGNNTTTQLSSSSPTNTTTTPQTTTLPNTNTTSQTTPLTNTLATLEATEKQQSSGMDPFSKMMLGLTISGIGQSIEHSLDF